MLAVAVTGGIACGKTTVVSALAGMGFATVSADEIARDVFGREETQRALALALGLDRVPERKELSRMVATDAAVREAVDAVTHPRIMDEIVMSGSQVVEVPLLFEACIQRFFCCSLAVVCPPEVQVERLVGRGFEPGFAWSLVDSQLGVLAKSCLSDFVLRTDRPFGPVLEDVRLFGQELKELLLTDVLYSPVEPGVDSEQA